MSCICSECKNIVSTPFDLKFTITIYGSHLFLCNECFINEQEKFEKEKERIRREIENDKLLEEIKLQNGINDFRKQREDFYNGLRLIKNKELFLI